MFRRKNVLRMVGLVALAGLAPLTASAADITGDYLESRTCDIFTGPCFANAEVGLTGQEAIMAWSIDKGTHDGVDLSGLSVIVAVKASDTLGFGGGVAVNPHPIRSTIVVDAKATPVQREALVRFAKQHAERVTENVVRVDAAPIKVSVDHVDMVGKLEAGDKKVQLRTRKLTKGDCICTNEVVYYPPLADVMNAAPAFTLQGRFDGRGLGTNWENPGTRSAFLATFAY